MKNLNLNNKKLIYNKVKYNKVNMSFVSLKQIVYEKRLKDCLNIDDANPFPERKSFKCCIKYNCNYFIFKNLRCLYHFMYSSKKITKILKDKKIILKQDKTKPSVSCRISRCHNKSSIHGLCSKHLKCIDDLFF